MRVRELINKERHEVGSILAIIIFVGIALAVGYFLARQNKNDVAISNSQPSQLYFYSRKDYIMTSAEADFFRRLERLARDKYYVFPQIHLSALLKNQTNGKYWKAAFQRINRTSVDFVLVNRETLKTSYAVELDDRTHDAPSRTDRDNGVDRMLADAQIPLIRFRGVNDISDNDIINKIS